jgi:hypothetical protein
MLPDLALQRTSPALAFAFRVFRKPSRYADYRATHVPGLKRRFDEAYLITTGTVRRSFRR